MGRGSAYPYAHHVLIDELDVYDMDEEDFDQDSYDFAWDNLLDAVVTAFDAWRLGEKQWLDNECYLFAETDRLSIGLDSGGGSPCLFLKPATWSYWRKDRYGDPEEVEVQYNLTRDATRGFNRLIRLYPYRFAFWTSSYTSTGYGIQGGPGDPLWLYTRKSTVIKGEERSLP